MRDQLYEAVQELEGTLAVADTATERSGRPEGRGDDSVHAGLGFRQALIIVDMKQHSYNASPHVLIEGDSVGGHRLK